MQFQLSCAAVVASLAVPAAAQQANPGGSIPIYDITPQVAPTPVPTSTPIATPIPTPTPRATPAPRPTATPTPPTPRPRVTPSPTSTPSPLPAPAPTPQATYVGPQVLPTPEPTATPEPAVAPGPTPTLEIAPAPTDDALPWWLWFLGGIVVATGAALLFTRLRRGQAGVVEDIAPVAPVPVLPPEPVAPPPPPRPVTPLPAPVAPTPGPFLEFQLAPLRVGTEGDRVLLDFDLTVGNPAAMPVAEVRIATMLLTAHAEQDEALATFFANDAKRGLDPFALGAGERRHLEATMTLPRVAVNIVTARDRPFFVPMIAIDARYRWEDGRESRTTAAFMVGPTAPQGKLAPIFTDRGDRMTERLEVRLYGQVRRT